MKTGVVISLASVALVLLLAMFTWYFVMDRIDRIMVLDLLGLTSLGGQ